MTLHHFLRASSLKLNELTLITSHTVDGTSITIPATVKSGDILILWVANIAGDAQSENEQVLTMPTSWTKVFDEFHNSGAGGATTQQNAVWIKIADEFDANEEYSFPFLNSQTGARRKRLHVFEANSPASSLVPGGFNYTFFRDTATYEYVNVESGNDIGTKLVCFFARCGNNLNTPPFLTPEADGIEFFGPTAFLYKFLPSSSTDIEGALADGGNSNFLGGFYINLL